MRTEIIYKKLTTLNDELENEYNPIGMHSKGLSEYLISKSRDYENLSQWFHIANGIKDLDYDGINYDSGFFMCRPAYEYESERQKLFHRLVKEITLFSYVYSGLEAIISELQIRKCPKNPGKINAACFLISQKLSIMDCKLKLYFETIYLAEQMFIETFDKNFNLKKELENKCVNWNGLGLRLLYKVRNMIMHGDFFFPEPFDYTFIPPLQPEIIRLCSRLTLLSTQILLLTQIDVDSNGDIEIYNSTILNTDEEGESIINEKDYLMGMHVKRPDYDPDQLCIEFDKN